jgi:hypothetical protein
MSQMNVGDLFIRLVGDAEQLTQNSQSSLKAIVEIERQASNVRDRIGEAVREQQKFNEVSERMKRFVEGPAGTGAGTKAELGRMKEFYQSQAANWRTSRRSAIEQATRDDLAENLRAMRSVRYAEKLEEERLKELGVSPSTARAAGQAAKERMRRMGLRPDEDFGGGGEHSPGRVLGRHAATLMGGPAGELMGMSAHLTRSMNVFKAAAVAGSFVIVDSIKGVIDETRMLRFAQDEYNNSLVLSSLHWQHIQAGVLKTSSIGREFRNKEMEGMTKAKETGMAWEKELLGRGLFETLGTAIEAPFVGGIEETAIGKRSKIELQKIKDAYEESRKMRGLANRAEEMEFGRNVERRRLAEEETRVGGYIEGPYKQERQMRVRQQKERLEMEASQKDALIMFDVSTMQAREKLAKAGVVYDVQFEKQNKVRAINLLKEQETERRQTEARFKAEAESLDLSKREFTIKQTEQLEQSKLKVAYTGWDRQLGLMRVQATARVNLMKRGGYDVTQQMQIDQAEEAAALKDHNYQVSIQMAELQERLESAQVGAPLVEIAWRKMARSLSHDLSISGEQLEGFRKKFFAMSQAEADFPLRQGIRGMVVDLALARHEITQLEATRRRLAIENPKASPEVLEESARAQERARTAQWTRQQREALRPELALATYVRELRAAQKAGQLDADEADKLLRKRGAELGVGKRMDVGQFQFGFAGGNMFAKSVLDFTKLNLDVPIKTLEKTTDKDGQTLVVIRDLLGKILAKEVLN